MKIYQMEQCRHGKFLTNINDTYVGHSLRTYGEWSEAEITLFSQIVRHGDTVLEAGSNIGSHTTWFSSTVGDMGCVHSFEANRHTHQLLCANLALNECLNVHAHHAAIGAAAGKVSFPVPDPKIMNNFGAVSLKAPLSGKVEVVRQVAVDDLELEQLRFIKSDIEGCEPELLMGARETLARLRPILFLELFPVAGQIAGNRNELVAFLNDIGYACYYYLAPMFNASNFRSLQQDIFSAASIDILCVPTEKAQVHGLTRAGIDDGQLEYQENGIVYSFLPWTGVQVQFF